MSDRLRILHLTAGSDAGGLSRYIFDLCAAMHEQGHEVFVAGERGAWHGMFEKAPWPWIDVPLKGGPFALRKAARVLREYFAQKPIDVFHTHYRRATLVARKLQVNLVPSVLYTVHLSDLSLAWPRRMFSDFGDHTHVASEEARRWVIDDARVPADRVSIIPHGIQTERFPLVDETARRAARAALGLHEDDVVAAYVGRLDDPKNADWLLDLAAASREQLPRLRMLLAGDGPHGARLGRRITGEQLQDRVTLLGQRQPLPIYQAADALLLPSVREGFSYACAEAMCVGVPVLRTRTAGTIELILEGETGRSVPIDRDAFVTAGVAFLQDRAALSRMGQAAAKHVRTHFQFDRQLQETLSLYYRLAGASR